jgi:DNA polymerase III sliding clamp (beta) subunit (PCNA family)
MQAPELKKVLQQAGRFIEVSPLPILSAVYFDGETARTTMNLKEYAVIPCPVPFPFVVLPKPLIAFLGTSKGEVYFEREEGSDDVFACLADSRLRLESFDPLDFPFFPSKGTEILSTKDLLSAFSRIVSYFKEKNENSPALRKIQFRIVNHVLTLSATDGRRLSVLTREDTLTPEVSFRISGIFAQKLVKVKDPITGFSVTGDGNYITFFCASGAEYSFMDAGPSTCFPNFGEIIGENPEEGDLLQLIMPVAAERK